MKAKPKNTSGWLPVIFVCGALACVALWFVFWPSYAAKKSETDAAAAVEKSRAEWMAHLTENAKKSKARAKLSRQVVHGESRKIRSRAKDRLHKIEVADARRSLDNATTESARLIARRELEKLLDEDD